MSILITHMPVCGKPILCVCALVTNDLIFRVVVSAESAVSYPKVYSPFEPFTRKVSIRRDPPHDFVVVFEPEDIVVFRHSNARDLRRVCSKLRWLIVSDVTPDLDDPRTL